MNSKICANCRNNKPVNSTDNRLVTEACGHVKCMDCLLLEKSGCVACAKMKIDDTPRIKTDEETLSESESVQEYLVKLKATTPVVLPIEVEKNTKNDTSHIKVHTDENGRTVYTCIPCNSKNLKNKKFHARSQLAYHAYCNGQRKPYQCPEPSCKNKSFATHSHFEYHMRVHNNERSYACETCGERFFRKSNLQRHKLKHTKEKKFACMKCMKAFNNTTSLRKHELTHTDERPYACNECGLRFRDSSNFKKHRDKHEGKGGRCSGGRGGAAAALQCPSCPQSFRAARDLRRHQQVHTDSKPYRCKECGSNFRRKDNLERHIRNSHPNIDIAATVEINVDAIKQMAEINGLAAKQPAVEADAKKQLEILNPLPPLPPEVIQKHMASDVKETIDKSYIIEANNTRESVIVEKKVFERTTPSPEYPYVHKIRKANAMRSNPLPPIDVEKVKKLEITNLDIGAPSKDIEKERRYKNILLAPKLDKNCS